MECTGEEKVVLERLLSTFVHSRPVEGKFNKIVCRLKVGVGVFFICHMPCFSSPLLPASSEAETLERPADLQMSVPVMCREIDLGGPKVWKRAICMPNRRSANAKMHGPVNVRRQTQGRGPGIWKKR